MTSGQVWPVSRWTELMLEHCCFPLSGSPARGQTTLPLGLHEDRSVHSAVGENGLEVPRAEVPGIGWRSSVIQGVVEPAQVPEVLMTVDDQAFAASRQTSPSGNPYLASESSCIATQYPGAVGAL
jgi:hypothetical protein